MSIVYIILFIYTRDPKSQQDGGIYKLYMHTSTSEFRRIRTQGHLSCDFVSQESQSRAFTILNLCIYMLPNSKSSESPAQEMDETREEMDHIREDDLVALCLGRSSLSVAKNKDHLPKASKQEDDSLNQGLVLRLDGRSYEYSGDQNDAGVSKSQSPTKIEEESETDQKWGSSIGLKAARSEEDEALLQQHPAKKARVAVRAICNGPTMNDGCQWRKYGQKIAKGNPCPRAYYRCTMSTSCPVRKHVQRCQEDLSILLTTYEGSHNHGLPPAATAMASTTSAAVSMLKTSSTSTSQPSLSLPSATSATTKFPPFYAPNTTISTSQSHPTITLDLTTPSAYSHYNKYSSTFLPPHHTTYSPAASLNFSASSSSSSASFEHWRNQSISSSSYASLYNRTELQLPLMPHKNNFINQTQPQFSIEKIADATKEITSNPSFQSALAAAISSIVGKKSGGIAETMQSQFATSHFNSIFPQAGNLKFDFSPFASSKGDFRKL
ncbi:hypothetical protein DCAR_0936019 [Daucus carota subsp. sativus]|uniref:WRKY domain-containing protein n=1 Tax=Daucus carota subsp. sativus TaxID=79200 RepID=A0AAF0XY62_DAUCS|nr:hypothetical protein DCAR_0936019 [Daucus carota subsp. sativus]